MKLKPRDIKMLKDMGAQEGQMELLQAIASYAVFTLPRLRGERIRATELIKLWGRQRFCAVLMAVLNNKITNTVKIEDGSHSPAGVVDVYFDYNKCVAPMFKLRHFTFKRTRCTQMSMAARRLTILNVKNLQTSHIFTTFAL